MDNTTKVPFEAEIERHVLGMLLGFNDAFEKASMLTVADFYVPRNKKMFCVIREVYNLGREINLATVFEQCQKMGLDKELNTDVIIGYTEAVCSSVDIKRYIGILKEQTCRRRLLSVGNTLLSDVGDATKPSDSIITNIQYAIDDIAGASSTSIVPMPVLIESIKREVNDEEAGINNNVRTGFCFIDENGGLHPSDLVSIGAYPAVGKSALTAKMAYNIATQGNGVVYYSLEMPAGQIVRRLCSIISYEQNLFDGITPKLSVSQTIGNNPKRDREETNSMMDALNEIKGLPLYIIDDKNTMDEITSNISEHVRQAKVKVVFIDYAQNIRNTTKATREEFLGECCKIMKAVAKRHKICIVLLTQLTQNTNKDDRRPHYYNAKGASSIYEGSDMFLTIDRPEADDCGDNLMTCRSYEGKHRNVSTHDTAEIKVCKNKNGQTGSFIIGFKAPYTDFYNLDELPMVECQRRII